MSTGGSSKSGGAAVTRNEWVLKANTTYAWRFTADSTSARVMTGLFFYEGAP